MRYQESSAPTRAIVGAVLVSLGLSGHLTAQQPTGHMPADSAGMAQALSGMMSQMNPMYISMSKGMVEGTLQALDQPATAVRLASFMRRYFEALVKAGFSTDEALQIVVAVGLPTGKTAK